MIELNRRQTSLVSGAGVDHCTYAGESYDPGAIIAINGGHYLQCVEVPSLWNLLGIEYYGWANYLPNMGC
ncbi:MAG TPA: hypothetical protein VNR18_14410 [Hyphomicrobiales bacterium]|nr:hypothetical protein [Hyphomicrobiales bacterium]